MIIDNSPNSYQFQHENGIPILSWYDDPYDRELMKMLPALILLSQVDDVRPVILQSVENNVLNCKKAEQICESLMILKAQNQGSNKPNQESESKKKRVPKVNPNMQKIKL